MIGENNPKQGRIGISASGRIHDGAADVGVSGRFTCWVMVMCRYVRMCSMCTCSSCMCVFVLIVELAVSSAVRVVLAGRRIASSTTTT